MTKNIDIPDKLSTFIHLVTNDAQSLDEKLYHPKALSWHVYENDTCGICFAGAWLASLYTQRGRKDLLKYNLANLIEELDTYLKSEKLDIDKLRTVLEYLRIGCFFSAITLYQGQSTFNYKEMEEISNLQSTVKERNFKGWNRFRTFLKSMNLIADELAAIGF